MSVVSRKGKRRSNGFVEGISESLGVQRIREHFICCVFWIKGVCEA